MNGPYRDPDKIPESLIRLELKRLHRLLERERWKRRMIPFYAIMWTTVPITLLILVSAVLWAVVKDKVIDATMKKCPPAEVVKLPACELRLRVPVERWP